MLSRRGFVTSVGALAAPAALMAYTPTAFALPLDAGSTATAPLQELIRQRLSSELGATGIARTLEPHLFDVAFTWRPPTVPAASIDSIVAYAFGNRPNADSGNTSVGGGNQAALPDPGPTNELLADAVHAIRQLRPVKVYAQWEIARFLVSKYGYGPDQLFSVEPIIAADGTITYLSTDGVAAAAITEAGSAAALGQVAVVGHRDHVKRCVMTSAARGMKAATAAEIELPVAYDALSGQPWTRDRDIYLVHDMFAQLFVLSLSLVAAAYPAS